MIALSQHAVVGLLIKAFLFGVALGVFCDLLRLLKMLCGAYFCRKDSRAAKKILSHAVNFAFDVLFFIVAAISSVLLMYSVGGGIFRGMTYVGMAVGFLLYYLTVSKLVAELSKRLTFLLWRLLRRLLSLISIPIKAALRGIISLYHLTIGRFVGKIKAEIKLRREKSQAARTEEQEKARAEADEIDREGGKEAFVYVSENCRYRREGRIKF